MIEKVFVKDLIADSYVDSPFLIQSFQVKQKKNGEDFLSLQLKDKSGEVGAVMWDGVAEVVNEIGTGDYVQVSGKVGLYNEKPQITIMRLKRLEPDLVDESDYVPATGKNVDKMWKQLMEVINSIGNLHLRRLLLEIFEDEAVAEQFVRAPAAKGHHHTFLGGLLEHTLSIARLCEMAAEHYAILDRDLLVTGGLLHDYAKIEELTYERQFDYTDEGRLLGHIVIAAASLDRRMREQEFPDKLRVQVLHMIISHHGEEQFGSPRKPMTAEAIALHFIDMLDSRMEMVRAALEREKDLDGSFTSYLHGLDRFLYKG